MTLLEQHDAEYQQGASAAQSVDAARRRSSSSSSTTDTAPVLAGNLMTIAEDVRRSTVQVSGRRGGTGSGVIWRADGLIVTNAHVVSRRDAAVRLANGTSLRGVVIAKDERRDLALLRVDARNLPAAKLGDANSLRVGEIVLAVGNPFGTDRAVTVGIIHAVAAAADTTTKRIDAQQASRDSAVEYRSAEWIAADVRLAPGNSGGPLANARGQVIGINTMIAGGLALAVPSAEVQRFVRRIDQPGESTMRLGVKVMPTRRARWKDAERRLDPATGTAADEDFGLVVVEIQAGSNAEVAGLMIGDVLYGVNGNSFAEFSTPSDAIAEAFQKAQPGGVLQLHLRRGGKHIICEVHAGSAAADQVAA